MQDLRLSDVSVDDICSSSSVNAEAERTQDEAVSGVQQNETVKDDRYRMVCQKMYRMI